MTTGLLKTLLAEDNLPTCVLLQSVLELYGICRIADNGSEGVEAFKAAHAAGEPYNLVCLDIMMPVMDGREALRRIRRWEAEHGIKPEDACKVLMTTALGDEANVRGAFDDGCDGYLVKPIDPVNLVVELRRVGLLAPAEVET